MLSAFKASAGGRPRPAGLTYVGGLAVSSGGTGGDASPTVSLIGLTGGIDYMPTIGDLIVAAIAFKDNTADRNIGMLTSGYTEQADLFFNSTNDVQLGIYTKRLTAPELSLEFDLPGSSPYTALVSVWSGTHATTPIDAATVAATGGTGGPPDPSSITTVTNAAVVLAVGAQAGAAGTALTDLTAPSGMTSAFLELMGSSSQNVLAIAQLARPTAGAYNPAAFGGGSSNAANSWVAATLALRPA